MPRKLGLLVVAAMLLLFTGLGGLDLWAPDEPRIAQVAEEMRSLEHGPSGFVLLHLNGEPYSQKPPLYYWLAWLFALPGDRVSELPARLPSAIAGVATVTLTAVWGSRLLGPAVGLLGGALLLTVYRFAHLARRAQFDVVLCLLELVALVAFWRLDRNRGGRATNVALLHGAMGLALLTKGPVGLLIPLFFMLAFLWWEGRVSDLRRAFPPWSLCLSLGPVLAWLGAAVLLAPEGFLGDAVGTNVFGRFFSGTSHARPPWYYLYQFPLDFLPWTLLWPLVVWAGRRRVFAPGSDPARRRAWRLLLACVGVSLVFFSLSTGKRGLYLLPAFPAAALLCADALRMAAELRGGVPRWLVRTAAGLGALFVVAAGVVTIGVGDVLAPWPFALVLVLGVVGATLAWRWTTDAPATTRFAAIVAGALCVELAVFVFFLPTLNAEKSPRPIGEAAAAWTQPREAVGLVGDASKAPAFAYYSNRRVRELKTSDDVRDFLAAGGRVLIVRRSKLERVEAVTPVVVRAALRRPGRRQFVVVSPASDPPG